MVILLDYFNFILNIKRFSRTFSSNGQKHGTNIYCSYLSHLICLHTVYNKSSHISIGFHYNWNDFIYFQLEFYLSMIWIMDYRKWQRKHNFFYSRFVFGEKKSKNYWYVQLSIRKKGKINNIDVNMAFKNIIIIVATLLSQQ